MRMISDITLYIFINNHEILSHSLFSYRNKLKYIIINTILPPLANYYNNSDGTYSAAAPTCIQSNGPYYYIPILPSPTSIFISPFYIYLSLFLFIFSIDLVTNSPTCSIPYEYIFSFSLFYFIINKNANVKYPLPLPTSKQFLLLCK